jgi:hypothetical protein
MPGSAARTSKYLLTAPRYDFREVIVPTESLYMAVLPDTHPRLDDLKVRHRSGPLRASWPTLALRRWRTRGWRYCCPRRCGSRIRASGAGSWGEGEVGGLVVPGDGD